MPGSKYTYPRHIRPECSGMTVYTTKYDAETETYSIQEAQLEEFVVRNSIAPMDVIVKVDGALRNWGNIFYVFPDKEAANKYISLNYERWKIEKQLSKIDGELDKVQNGLRAKFFPEFAG